MSDFPLISCLTCGDGCFHLGGKVFLNCSCVSGSLDLLPGARHQFAPAVAMKQPIHRTVIDVVPDALGVSLPDLPHRRDLPRFGLREKRSEEVLLFFERQILTSPPSLTFRFNRCDAETIVAGDHRKNGCFGHATVPNNLFSGSWLDQGVVDNQLALPRHRALIGSHSMFHFCDGQMGAAWVTRAISSSPLVSPGPNDSKMDSRAQRGCAVSLAHAQERCPCVALA